ncbi:hypothetical protein CDAR_453281 [Caerostris darwini]|uniref:Uncharacterized protein n=1 Tax=Caerostris darwini TaxID=1538125 RepID=A0AAV4RVZ8_9ARAC|nr:hypothetical protein CDAR_453281 [Caerostris darwini]
MDLPTPQLIDLTSWGDEASATSREIWEISVPEECSFVWSIILARAASLNADWEMTSKNLLPKDEEKEEFCLKINEIVSFNPFKNRHTLFLDESLTQLIRKIDEKLNIHVKNVMQKDETFTEDSHLKEAASAMLLCRIKVLRTDFQNDKTITRQAKTFLDRQSSDTTIVIFEKYMNSPNEARFSFGMDLRRANSLRKMSLESILREAKLYVKDIGGIIKPVTEQERIFNCNFLLTLIESQPIELIEGLYKSPYIVWKLADAGFNTNPFYTQGGNSAFFYCLGLESSRLLYVLYNYAINNYHRTGKSVRNPNSDVLNALKNVDDKLKDHYKMIIKRQYSELHEHVLERKAWFEIFHFNKYQKTVIKKISAMPDNDLNSNFKMAKIKCVLKKSKFLSKSEKLLNILKSNTYKVPNNPNKIMRIINKALESYPEIKDDFAIKRLERYLMVAAKEPNGIKKVLATKRAIQVLGETLIVSPGKDLFGKTLLRCTLPAQIERLKEILVDENRDIKYLFSSNCNEGEKKHAIFLMCESYKKNHGFRFSAEMLLFDCLNIFEKRKDLDDLKEKLSGLFSGINLRNVLSHGDVLLENMGLYLDKDDLPSNLIEKMLQLIDDLPALKALSDLWWETNSNNCKEFKNELSKIKGTPLSEKIKNCPRWQEYMLLLPLQ